MKQVAPYPGEKFAGRVKTVGGVIDLATRTFFAEAEFPNSDGRLLPRAVRPGLQHLREGRLGSLPRGWRIALRTSRETNQQIGGLREEFVSLREETAQRFDRLEEKVRHNGVEIEALRGEIRQVGEGVAGANQSLSAVRQEVAVEFKDVRSSIRVPFENLNKRVLVLEAKVEVLGKNPQKGKSRPPS
jgi:hypothetical protein